jgi:hypothetical protein
MREHPISTLHTVIHVVVISSAATKSRSYPRSLAPLPLNK